MHGIASSRMNREFQHHHGFITSTVGWRARTSVPLKELVQCYEGDGGGLHTFVCKCKYLTVRGPVPGQSGLVAGMTRDRVAMIEVRMRRRIKLDYTVFWENSYARQGF